MENGHRNSGFNPLNMVIFHSSVSLPEGKVGYDSWLNTGPWWSMGPFKRPWGQGNWTGFFLQILEYHIFRWKNTYLPLFAIICHYLPQEIGESSTRFMRKSLERPVSNQHVTCCWARQSDEWLDSQQYWHFMAIMVISPSEVFLAWG